MLKFSSSLSRSLCSWILIFCTKQKKNTVPYVENWENPLTVKDCCERAFEKKGIWHHLQQYSCSPFSYRSPYFISGIFILKLISITDRGMTLCWCNQCYFSSWRFVEIFSPSFLLPDKAVFPYSTLFMS